MLIKYIYAYTHYMCIYILMLYNTYTYMCIYFVYIMCICIQYILYERMYSYNTHCMNVYILYTHITVYSAYIIYMYI